jgi:hypothetical protein
MRGTFKPSPEHLLAIDRVRAWTRARFALPDTAAILATEIACKVPGCPPVETVIAFWTDGNTLHHFKLFKPVTDVVEDDLPPTWMKSALVAIAGLGLECC